MTHDKLLSIALVMMEAAEAETEVLVASFLIKDLGACRVVPG